jgi:hypothetical protein
MAYDLEGLQTQLNGLVSLGYALTDALQYGKNAKQEYFEGVAHYVSLLGGFRDEFDAALKESEPLPEEDHIVKVVFFDRDGRPYTATYHSGGENVAVFADRMKAEHTRKGDAVKAIFTRPAAGFVEENFYDMVDKAIHGEDGWTVRHVSHIDDPPILVRFTYESGGEPKHEEHLVRFAVNPFVRKAYRRIRESGGESIEAFIHEVGDQADELTARRADTNDRSIWTPTEGAGNDED